MLKYVNDICYSYFFDSSDDDEVYDHPKLLRICARKSLRADLQARHSKKSHQVGSRSLIESRTDPYRAASSTSRQGGDENGVPNLIQASTSYEPVNTMSYPRTSSLTSRKVESSKKHSSRDSDSSSNESLYSSVSYPVSGHELHEQTWTFDEGAFLPTSVSETGRRGKKRRHSSSVHSSVPNEPSTSAHSFIASESANALKVKNFVSVTSKGWSMTDKSSKEQEGDPLCQRLKTVSGSSSASMEVNCSQESDVPRPNDSEHGRSSKADLTYCGQFYVNARRKFHRVSQCNRYFGPHLYHHPHIEPSNDSTISDLCIMSFVLKDNETDEAGYVRIMSPQLESSRPELHTLVVKNYKMITDASLTYLLKLESLRYLDVSGTSVTETGVLQFKLKRPDVKVISNYKDLPI
jgi:hypothetical protein